MKTSLIISVFCLLSPFVNAQYGRQIGIEDLGNAFYNEVKNSQSVKPCEESPGKALTYCVEDGSKITYTFENYRLTGIINLTAFLLKSQAESELQNEITLYSRKWGIKPYYSNGMAMFFSNKTDISVAFGVTEIEGTYYLATYFTKI